MLSRADKWFLIYLATGYVAFAEILSWETSNWPACIVVSQYQSANNQPGYQTCATLHEGIMRFLAFIWAHTTHDNIIAFATVMVAIFTWTIWRVNRSQLQRSREVERAYVSGGVVIEWEETGEHKMIPTGIGFNATSVPITRPRWLIVTVDNHGKTPAFISEIAMTVCEVGALPGAPEYETAKRLANLNVSPGTVGLRTQFVSDFKEAGGKLVYGRVYYTDIFRSPHSSGFILRVLSSTTGAAEAPSAYSEWD
jgi:hypothetical protein